MNDKSKYLFYLGINENATVEDVKSAVDKRVSKNQDDLQSKEPDVRRYAEDNIEYAKYAGDKLVSILESERKLAEVEIEVSSDDDVDFEHHMRLEAINRFYDGLKETNQLIIPHHEHGDEDQLLKVVKKNFPELFEEKRQVVIICNSGSDAVKYYDTGNLKITLLCLNGYEKTKDFIEYRDHVILYAGDFGFQVEAPEDDKIHLYFKFGPEFLSVSERSDREKQIKFLCEMLGLVPTESQSKLQDQYEIKLEEFEDQLLTVLPLEKQSLESMIAYFRQTYDTLVKVIGGSEDEQSIDPITDERIDMIIEFYEGLERKDIICSQNYKHSTEENHREFIQNQFPEIGEKKVKDYIICNSAIDGLEYGRTGKLKVTFLCWDGYELDPYFKKLKEAVVTFAKEVGFHVEAPPEDLTHIYLDARFDPITGDWINPLE